MAESENKAIVAPTSPGELAKWDEKLAQFAKQESARERLIAGRFLSLRGGRFAIAGTPLGQSLDVIVLGSVFENDYFENVNFDPDEYQSPACYAVAAQEGDLVPHEDCEDPQSERCFGCRHNAFGTGIRAGGARTKGKRCQNRRRLALMAAKDLSDAERAEVIYFRIPVTQARNWGLYVKMVAGMMNRPPFAVVTRMKVEPDPDTQVKLTFEFVENVGAADLPRVLKRAEEQMSGTLLFGYPKQQKAESGTSAAPEGYAGPRTEKY